MVAEVVSVAVEDRHQQAACFTTAPDTGHHRSLSHVFYPRVGIVEEPRPELTLHIFRARVRELAGDVYGAKSSGDNPRPDEPQRGF
jgi:hypothetical protein